MAIKVPLSADRARATRDGIRASLSSDPALPRTLIELVLATGDAGSGRPPRQVAGATAMRQARRPRPPRLPSVITVEMPPNILYRRFPLVTSLLVELDELRRSGAVPPTRRRR